ncbi:MAG TPA: beta-propeller fold lactonase family protein [Polyangia bacterium]
MRLGHGDAAFAAGSEARWLTRRHWLGWLAGSAGALAFSRRANAAAVSRIYVSNEDSGDVTVIDEASLQVVATIAVGKRPRGIRVGPDGKRLFVALSGSPKAPPGVDESTLPPPDPKADGIGVVDLGTGKLGRILRSGPDPECFDITRDGRTLLVSNEESGDMSFVDGRSGRVTKKLRVGGEPEGVTLRPDGQVVYVTCEVDNAIAVVDVARRRLLRHIEVGARPRAVVFTADGRKAYVTCELSAEVMVLDGHEHSRRKTIAIAGAGARPMGLAIAADQRTVYVSNGRGKSVAIIDTATDDVVATVTDVGVRPWGLAVSKDQRRLYTANGPSHDVAVIDLASRRVVQRIAAGQSPWGVALTPGI